MMMKKILATTIATAAFSGVAFAGGHAGHGGMNSPIGELPNARPGQCFARIVTPAQYEKVPETVVVQEGFEQMRAVQPEFRETMSEVMVKEAGVQYVVRQPRYEVRQEQVMVKPGHERLVIEPARFEYVTETIQVGEPRMMWKPGANLSNTQRVDARTGQVYCLVEVPGKTQTITKRVMVQPEQMRRETVDAQFINISKQVLVDRGGVEEVPVAPEFRSIPVKELVAPGRAERSVVAPKTSTVERTVLRAAEKFEWVEVLCETNATTGSISDAQKALATRGFYKGPIDGILGPKTQAALNAFQSSNGLPHQGYVTIDTLRMLGLAPAAASHPAPVAPPRKAHPQHSAVQTHQFGQGMGHEAKAASAAGAGHGYGHVVVEKRVIAHRGDPAPLNVPHRATGGPVEIQGSWVSGGVGSSAAPQTDAPAFEQQTERREYSVRKRLNWEGK